MIQTEDLTKRFNDFLAVDGVSLEINPGQVLALLGPNGAGKTTTIRMLTSILRPNRGWAKVAGHDVVQNSAVVRASVGVLTEQHGLYGRMPAEDYLDFFGQIYGMDKYSRHERINQLLDRFGLSGDRVRKISEFSKGMRQKLALVRALMHNPPVLLLDEPTSAMDPESAKLVRDSIAVLRSDRRTIMICTHNLAEAEELADQIAIIREGKIVASGSPGQLKRTLLGQEVYTLNVAKVIDEIPELPVGVRIISQGPDWVCYQTDSPRKTNPTIIEIFHENNLPVMSLYEKAQSLEAVYLQVVSIPEEVESINVK
jgi:ABC-2 type transport system ATP-binding protein